MLDFPRWKIVLVLVVCLASVYLALPNFMTYDEENPPAWLPARKVNLGLDLRGGSHLLLEVDSRAYFREQYDALVDDIRGALNKERIGYQGLGGGEAGASFILRDPAQEERARALIRELDSALVVEDDEKLAGEVAGAAAFRVAYSKQEMARRQGELLEQSIEIIRRRVDATGTREPTIQRQGSTRILVQVPGVDDPERLKQIIGRTARMTFHMVQEIVPQEQARRTAKPGSKILPSDGRDGRITHYQVERHSMLSGDMLVQANATYDEMGRPAVAFRLNPRGGKIFGEITTKHVGELFAIVLDNKIISAPQIREPILGGSGIITMGSAADAQQEAQDLALLLRAGALPAPLTVVEERSVGPSLGQDSIDAGTEASLVGTLLVIVFMFLAYGIFGIFSNVALVMNIVMILAMLSLFQATLTLPGIAGIVLTIGMAVDANVLIFERMREEYRLGKSVLAAMQNGFDRAFVTILDSNLTTLIAAVLLYYFGTGTIKGFAVTLSIGILCSMFTAILLTRLQVAFWARRKRPRTLPI